MVFLKEIRRRVTNSVPQAACPKPTPSELEAGRPPRGSAVINGHKMVILEHKMIHIYAPKFGFQTNVQSAHFC